MATSKSREGWIAGAFIYSGRRDPTWNVPKTVVRKLHRLWDATTPAREKPSPPRLGYRGVFLRAPDGREWTVFNGLVSLTTPDETESRTDPAREFEKSLLASAPEGLLPEGFSTVA
jgi:hypothetical protein